MGEIADDHEDEFLSGDYVRAPPIYRARPRRQLQQYTIAFSHESGAGGDGPTWRMSGIAEVMAYTSSEAMGLLRKSNPMFRHAFLEVLRP